MPDTNAASVDPYAKAKNSEEAVKKRAERAERKAAREEREKIEREYRLVRHCPSRSLSQIFPLRRRWARL